MSTLDPIEQLFESVDPSVFKGAYPSSARMDADIAWVSSHRQDLEKYEGKWIAVYNQTVIASGKNGVDVEKRAFQKIGHPVPDLFLCFLESSTCVY